MNTCVTPVHLWVPAVFIFWGGCPVHFRHCSIVKRYIFLVIAFRMQCSVVFLTSIGGQMVSCLVLLGVWRTRGVKCGLLTAHARRSHTQRQALRDYTTQPLWKHTSGARRLGFVAVENDTSGAELHSAQGFKASHRASLHLYLLSGWKVSGHFPKIENEVRSLFPPFTIKQSVNSV